MPSLQRVTKCRTGAGKRKGGWGCLGGRVTCGKVPRECVVNSRLLQLPKQRSALLGKGEGNGYEPLQGGSFVTCC